MMKTRPELLAALNRDQLVILPRDPDRGYLYWEITPGGLAEARAEMGHEAQGKLTCRISIVEGDKRGEFHRFDVSESFDGRFFNFPEPGAYYLAEVGLADPQGNFVPVVRSNAVLAPRRRPGDEEAHFVEARIDEQGLRTAGVDHQPPGGGFFPARQSRSWVGSTTRPIRS